MNAELDGRKRSHNHGDNSIRAFSPLQEHTLSAGGHRRPHEAGDPPHRVVIANGGVNLRPKSAERWRLLEKCQMSFATTVRRAKPPERDRAPHRMAKDANPLVFASHRVMRVPNLVDPKNRPQVIHVPMTAETMVHVTCNSGANPSGTKRTSDVYVKSISNRQHTEPAYRNLGLARWPAHERVSPRMRGDGSQA